MDVIVITELEPSADPPSELDRFLVTARKMICTTAMEAAVLHRAGKDFALMDVMLPQEEETIVNNLTSRLRSISGLTSLTLICFWKE